MKNIGLGIAVMALIFNISCTSKDKKDSEGSGQAAMSDESVEGKSLDFNPSVSDSGQIAGLDSIKFDYDRASLTAEARSELSANADWIKSHSDVTVQIEGHCDDRGSVQYNLALGEKRAKAVKDYLVTLGVASEKLSVISYGKEKPLEDGDSDAIFAKNRRANFVPMPK